MHSMHRMPVPLRRAHTPQPLRAETYWWSCQNPAYMQHLVLGYLLTPTGTIFHHKVEPISSPWELSHPLLQWHQIRLLVAGLRPRLHRLLCM